MSTPSHPKHRIFISHSHIDNEFGTRLAQDLSRVRGDESAVWYDVLGGLHGGDAWWEKILEELTARKVFIVVLSPEAMQSPWVRDEINLAWSQKNSREGKQIIPLLYRECKVRADLDTLQVISFLSPRTYETSFKEILMTLGLPTAVEEKPEQIAPHPVDTGVVLIQQMEAAFAVQDWPDVIRKADYLIKHLPGNATATVYRLKGLALLEEGEEQQGQEALETALALVSDRQLRLTLLGDYTTLLASQNQWAKVLRQAKEALRLVPNDPGWLATQARAQTKDKETPPVPQKTNEQWFEEGNTLRGNKRFEEALTAYDHAIRLDPKYVLAYYNLKHYDEALAAYDQTIRLDPNFVYAYHNKGVVLDNLGKSTEAKQAYDKARQLGNTG